MKNLLYLLLFSISLTFINCSSSNSEMEEETPITTESIYGTYVLFGFIDDFTNYDPIKLTDKNILTFNEDKTGVRYALKEGKIESFTWKIEGTKILFTTESIGDAVCTYKDNTITVKAKSEFSGNKGTFTYNRVK